MDQSHAKWVNVDHSQNASYLPPSAPYFHTNTQTNTNTLDSMSEEKSDTSPDRNHSHTSTHTQHESSISNSNVEHSTQHNYTNDQSPLSRNESISISVSEPVKQGEGMHAYISYKLNIRTNRTQFQKSCFTVIRRYSDFVWLHSALSTQYPGVVVPPLPEKLLVGRFSPEFVESRRRALQLFLVRCCLHPELQHNDQLIVFLESNEERLQKYKSEYISRLGMQSKIGQLAAAAVAGSSTATSLFQWIDEKVCTISSNMIGNGVITTAAGKQLIEKNAADVEIEEMVSYIDGLEPIMAGLYKHAHGLTKRAREIADGLFEFGVAFTQLGKSEINVSLQQGLFHIGECADRLSILGAEHAEKEAIYFEEPISDYIRLVTAVKAALQKRNEIRNSYFNTIVEMEHRLQNYNLLSSQKVGSDEKLQLAESEFIKAQQRVDDAKLEYDLVTERVIREVMRFRQQKSSDFKRIILDYIQLQIAYSGQVEEEWKKVVPKLMEIQIDSVAEKAVERENNDGRDGEESGLDVGGLDLEKDDGQTQDKGKDVVL